MDSIVTFNEVVPRSFTRIRRFKYQIKEVGVERIGG
jgi:hypothetical protein